MHTNLRRSSSIIAAVIAFAVMGFQARAAAPLKEEYVHGPMPPTFQVIVSELEGPVFADAQGRTLYMWPKRQLRNGDAGEVPNKPTCGNEKYRENTGYLSPYPGGLELPEVDSRPACTDVWPPVLAAADAKPMGRWTVVDRLDGRKQWAYKGYALYTSNLDRRPGDVSGGTTISGQGEGGAGRYPIGPEANVPGQFDVHTTMLGRLITLRNGSSVYTYDHDSRNKSTCRDACLDQWSPVLAPLSAVAVGEWTTFERTPGVLQWAFRGRPIYQHPTDPKNGSQDGSDTSGWHNVYTQMTPEPPKEFALKRTVVGMALGDSKGMTVYRYICSDDAVDQLSCDNPDTPQLYRFAVCGGGDPDRCMKTFPYVLAPTNAKTGNQLWGTMYIDPKTGKKAVAGQAGALNVWTFRDRPVYTFAGYKGYGDRKPSDINAHGWGEVNGGRNGYAALVYRDVFEARDGNIGRQ